MKFGKRYTMFEPDTFKDQEQTAQTAILGGTHPTVFYCFLGPDISRLEATKKGPKRSIFFHILLFFPFSFHFFLISVFQILETHVSPGAGTFGVRFSGDVVHDLAGGKMTNKKKGNYQWIGLRENLQESPIFNGKIYGFL